ncbi:hypothetical protein [Paenibacillus sp. 1781tsa1]|uniref:hypothetical protein n=1 Tax=Paenibacillus sp. 1781tsa1 TaxID=2953810 RepID=UPI0020A18E34|nr:hypothetical protein [Paenibacillus sp. 1781tsa1]MCP1184981.1 hypothetical protein [Paenibacillus sp. 1781tsa1]
MRNYDEEIARKQTEVEAKKDEMAHIHTVFMQRLALFFNKLYAEKAKKLVTDNAEKSYEVGEDNLKLLKQDVQLLIERSHELISEHLDKEELWWHQRENSKTYRHINEHRIPDFLEEQLRLVYGELGKVFEKHKIITIREHSDTRTHTGVMSDFGRKNGKIRYAYSFDLSEDVLQALNIYSEEHRKATVIISQIEELKREKAVTQIGDVWDSL